MPKEVADAGAANWKNVNGTGPFMLSDFVQGNSNTYAKNPIYWDKDKINGGEYKLPFVDKLVYRTIKDEATFITALRTGKLDILETIRWQNVEELKKSAPQLQVVEVAQHVRHLSWRCAVDTKPFDDIRVRRALNMAVNKKEIVSAYYNGNAELFAYPHASRLQGLLRAAGGDAGERQGAVRVQSRQGQEAAGRSRRIPTASRFKVQVCAVQPRPHGPAAAGGRLPREGRRQDRDPAHGVRRVPVGDDLAQDDAPATS